MVVVRKKTECTSCAIFESGPLPSAAISSDVPTEFPAEHNKDEVPEGKFRNMNFSCSIKKTTEYPFELFLSISRYSIFFSSSKLQFCRTESFAKQAKLLKKHFFKSDGGAISHQEKRRVPKSTLRFPTKKS